MSSHKPEYAWLYEKEEVPPGWEDLFREIAFRSGAAVVFGLMGMAEAIRQRCTCPAWMANVPPGKTVSWANVCERCKGYPV
jgi:hypothetical protein